MTDAQIIKTLKERGEATTIPRIISEFHCGYQMARRIWLALRAGLSIFPSSNEEVKMDIPSPSTEIDLFD